MECINPHAPCTYPRRTKKQPREIATRSVLMTQELKTSWYLTAIQRSSKESTVSSFCFEYERSRGSAASCSLERAMRDEKRQKACYRHQPTPMYTLVCDSRWLSNCTSPREGDYPSVPIVVELCVVYEK